MTPKRLPPIEWLVILVIVLVALALRLYGLDQQSFWSDEGLAVHYASPPAAELLQRIRVGFHNPSYFLGLHVWMATLGTSDWAIRFFSLVASLLAIPLMYRLGRLLYGAPVGLMAAFLLAVNPFAIYYAQEARMYAQILALSLAALLFFAHALRRNTVFAWIGFVLLSVAALYTHYFAALAPLAAAAFYVVSWVRGRYRSLTVRWLASQVALVVLYAPWLANALKMTSAESWQEPVSPLVLPWNVLASFSLGEVFPSPLRPYWVAAFALLFLVGCAALVHRDRSNPSPLDLYAPLALVVPLAFMMLLAWTGRGMLNKYLTVTLPAFLLILAVGLLRLRRVAWPLLAVGLLFVVSVDAESLRTYYTDVRYWKPDYRTTAAYISDHSRNGDIILADGLNPDIIFQRYYRGPLAVTRIDQDDAGVETQLLGQLTGDCRRAWLVLNFHQPGRIEYWLESHGYQIESHEFSTIRLYLYDFPPKQNLPDVQPSPIQQVDGPVRLAGYRLFPNPVASDDVAHVVLAWLGDRAPGVSYKVSVRLVDAAGRLTWSRDRTPLEGIVPSATWLPGRLITDSLAIPVPVGSLPGDYTIDVVLYDAASGAEAVKTTLGPLNIVRPTAPPAADLLPLTAQAPVPFGPELQLLDAQVPATPALAGSAVDVVLTWRAIAATGDEYDAVLQLLDTDGTMLSEERVSHHAYPTASWAAGEVVRFPYRLNLQPTLPGGHYALTVNLLNAKSGQPIRADAVRLGEVAVQSRPRTYKTPDHVSQPVTATFGPGARLLGYELSPSPVRGQSLGVTLFWQAEAPMTTNYTVFVHLLNAGGQLAVGSDHPPLNGDAPTVNWLKGEILTDRYELPIPADGPSGDYHLEIGLYDALTGQRLPVTRDGQPQADGRLLLDQAVTLK
jgi:mannosyltransferase